MRKYGIKNISKNYSEHAKSNSTHKFVIPETAYMVLNISPGTSMLEAKLYAERYEKELIKHLGRIKIVPSACEVVEWNIHGMKNSQMGKRIEKEITEKDLDEVVDACKKIEMLEY